MSQLDILNFYLIMFSIGMVVGTVCALVGPFLRVIRK